MDFSKKKLPKSELHSLSRVNLKSLKAYRLIFAPVYLWLRKNEKFISFKRPLDFFTEEEILKLSKNEAIYVPKSVPAIESFEKGAAAVKTLLTSKVQPKQRWIRKANLPPAPFEVSDAVLRLLGPLWSESSQGQVGVEPYLVTVFVNELCVSLGAEKLRLAREESVEAYERALLSSSWAVYLLLHLGYTDLPFLNGLRDQAFQMSMFRSLGKVWEKKLETLDSISPSSTRSAKSESLETPSQSSSLADLKPDETSTRWQARFYGTEIQEVIELAYEMMDPSTEVIAAHHFSLRGDQISGRISGRLTRIRKSLIQRGAKHFQVYGEGGFIAV